MSDKVRFIIRGHGPYELRRRHGQEPANRVAHLVDGKPAAWSAVDLMTVIHKEAKRVGYQNIEFHYETDLEAPPDLHPLLEDLQARISAAGPPSGSRP